MKNWRIKVKNFGKIKDADIELSNFTSFLGDNNSGKSYMMSLIYGLLSLKFFLLNGMQIDRNMSNYNQMKNWLKDLLDAPQKEIILTEDRYNDLLGLLNEILNYNKLIIMHTIFNANVDIESLEVLIPYYEKISIVKSKEVEGEEFVNFVTIKIGDKKRETIRIKEEQLKEEQTQDLLLIFIAEMILGTPLQEPSIYKPCYLPTSRTGFLLTYKTLAERSLSDKFNVEKSTKNLLTRPSSDFLTNLSMLTARDFNYEYKEIIEFIEEDILEGRVDAQELPASDFIYIPKGTKDSIPMFISSGVVTEITPLLLLLKHKKNISMLMMEEPEMCLHPKLQWSITRALIQLSNMNMPVIITTHSDTILQHINNMIQLDKNPQREELLAQYGYKDTDLITKDQVRFYQFDVKEHKTEVRALEYGEYGFIAPTFNDMLENLLRQSREFEIEE